MTLRVSLHSAMCEILQSNLYRKGNGMGMFLLSYLDNYGTNLPFLGPNLKVLATMTVGYDHIDVGELKARGIKFGNTPNVLNAAVAEIAVLLCLATARRLHDGRLRIET
jgi:glyoxylate/hydroxypyruvate reductase